MATFQPVQDFAISETAVPISAIILEMVKNDVGSKILTKNEIVMDMDIHEALNEACIVLGLSDEDYALSWVDQGYAIEVRLF